MSTRKIVAFLLVLALMLSFPNVSAVSEYDAQVNATAPGESIVPPLGLLIDEGTHDSAMEFSRTCFLNKINGGFVNFYIINNGTGYVTITINGSYSRTFAPGDGGHIAAPVTSTNQYFHFKCVSASGSNVNIYFKIAQRYVDTT